MICLEGMINARFLDDRDLAREVIHACNSWLADAVDGFTQRLLPVTCIDFGDVHKAIGELERMRARGSRAFLIGTVPVPGVPIMHPKFDPIWSAATDLGMIALLHIGYQPTSFDPRVGEHGRRHDVAPATRCLSRAPVGGADAQRLDLRRYLRPPPDPDRADRRMRPLLVRGCHRPHQLRDAHTQTEARLYMGEYPFELSPSEFVRRNVRITPLPRLHQSPARLLER